MSVYNEASAFTKAVLGKSVSKAYTPLVVETKTLFTVAGGLVLVTAIVGKVTTAITVANGVKLQANPTVGTTQDIFASTDLGTTDTPAGDLIGITGAPADGPTLGIGCVSLFGSKATLAAGDAGKGLIIAPGTIEQVTTTGADGGITWVLTYVALEDGATIVAA
jgi:hypothetical protein